jgi:hypothetical protein
MRVLLHRVADSPPTAAPATDCVGAVGEMVLHCHIVPTCLLEFQGKGTIGCEAGDAGAPLAAAAKVVLPARSPWGRDEICERPRPLTRCQFLAFNVPGQSNARASRTSDCYIPERPSGGGTPAPAPIAEQSEVVASCRTAACPSDLPAATASTRIYQVLDVYCSIRN